MLELSLRDSKECMMKDLEEDVDDKYKQIKTFHISGDSKKEKSRTHTPKGRGCQQSIYSWSSRITPFLILLTSLTFYTNPLSFLSNSSF